MSKRSQTVQGGGDRYGSHDDQQPDMADKPTQANAAQMARRKIAQTRKPSGSARSSRQGTPTAPNPFQSMSSAQQSAPSFLSQVQAGSDGGFNFMSNATPNNPFAQQNGTPPPPVQFGGQNGGSAFGGNNANSFGSSFGGNNNNANPAPQQNGFNPSSTSGLFSNLNNTNNTSSFGGFRQTNSQNTQPQQNGVTPSTATTATFPSFGKPNDENPFKNFPLSQTTPQQTQSTPGTSFGGFNSQQPNGDKAPATPSLGGFGTQQTGQKSSLFASTSDTPKPSTSLFTTDTPKPSTSLFSGLGQPNGTSKPEEPPKASSTSLFSNLQQSNASGGLFGAATSVPDQRPTSPGGSVLSGLDSARAGTVKAGMFTQSKTSETPKSNLFSFNQQGGSGADETPKANNDLFSAAKTNGATPNLFSSASNTISQTPAKQTSNLFSGSFSQHPQPSSTASGLNFGQSTQSQQDTSMTTPGNTPQKPSSNLFQQSQSQPSASEQSAAPTETPAGQGKSLFDRITPRDDAPATVQKPTFTPSTMFAGTNNKENETPSSNNQFQQTPSTQKQTTFAPSTSLFSQPASQASQTPSAAPWLSHAAATPTAPMTKVTPATPQPPATAMKATTASVSTSEPISEAEKGTLKVLNEGLMKHLTTQDPNADWTTIMQYYLQQAAKIRNKPEPTFEAPVLAQTASMPPSSSEVLHEKTSTGLQRTGLLQSAKPSTPSAANMFSSTFTSKPSPLSNSNLFAAAQTPKQSALNPLSSKPPSTAPINRKRPGPFTEDDDEEEHERGPATEKRVRHDEPINYPKLPENASSTSKLFESLINKPADKDQSAPEQQGTSSSSIGGFKPSASTTSTSLFQPTTSTSTGFTPANAGPPTISPTALKSGSTSSGGFQPTTSTSTGFTPANAGPPTISPTAMKSGQTTSTGGFQPNTSTSTSTGFTAANAGPPTVSPTALKSGNWLSAFGKKASAEEEKEKKKRKLEDYDSDEETEDEWKKRDEETQAAKRAKLMEEAQKGSGFVFNAAAAKTSGVAAKTFRLSQTPSEASDNELDDDKADAEKAQGSGDNTWKPNTPLKFGASTTGKETTTPKAPPPTLGNLFGSTPTTGGTNIFSSTPATGNTNLFGSTPANGSSSLLNVPGANKPTLNFNFASNPASSVATSRATTPGVTTDGEGSTAGEGDEDDGQPSEPQVEDQTGLRPEETANEDVLFTSPNTTARKIRTKKDPEAPGGQSRGWATVGCGPLYVLKNKDTGKARVLLKVPPYGNPKMNFPLMPKMNYEVTGKKGALVQGAFYDHIDEPNQPKVAMYLLDVGKDDAAELARLLNENRPKSAEELEAEAGEEEL